MSVILWTHLARRVTHRVIRRGKDACSRCFASQADDLKRTVLYDFHVKHGGKMVPFAGFAMPVQYQDGIVPSHLHTRSNVSVFDVSHMLQTKVYGNDRVEFIESLTIGDIQGLEDNQGTLTLFTTPSGGIYDDLIVTKTDEDYLYVVSNAGCIDKDLPNMMTRAEEMRGEGKDVRVDVVPNGLLAMQGPKMVQGLQPLIDIDLTKLTFMTSTMATVLGVKDCRITRCGYTGEDGVEISVPEDRTEEVADGLINAKGADVRLAGLGARDSLRLEAGLCLYGNDIDEDTSPVEASLVWTIGKRRREEANFPGASVILQQLKDKVAKKRVGFLSMGPPARSDAVIYDATGEREIGCVTSGCPSPSLKQNVAMGYIETEFAKIGTQVRFEVRKNMVEGRVSKMPFVPSKYYTNK